MASTVQASLEALKLRDKVSEPGGVEICEAELAARFERAIEVERKVGIEAAVEQVSVDRLGGNYPAGHRSGNTGSACRLSVDLNVYSEPRCRRRNL